MMIACARELPWMTSVAIFKTDIASFRTSWAVSQCNHLTGRQPSSMRYVVVRTKYCRQRDCMDVYPQLFITLNEAKLRARRWRMENLQRRRRNDRFVYSVHKVCLLPDFSTTLWHLWRRILRGFPITAVRPKDSQNIINARWQFTYFRPVQIRIRLPALTRLSMQ